MSITCIAKNFTFMYQILINQFSVNKMLWLSVYTMFIIAFLFFFQSLQVLKSSDLKPYIVFVYPPNMEKLRQMQKNFYPGTTITVRNLSIFSFSLSLSHEVIDLQLEVLQAVPAVLNFEQKHFIRNMHICEKAQIKKNPVVQKSDVI